MDRLFVASGKTQCSSDLQLERASAGLFQFERIKSALRYLWGLLGSLLVPVAEYGKGSLEYNHLIPDLLLTFEAVGVSDIYYFSLSLDRNVENFLKSSLSQYQLSLKGN